MKKKAMIAVSGGVDSAAAAILMKKKGYECIAAYMKLCEGSDTALEDAKKLASDLNIPFYSFDLREEFKEAVIERFIKSYESGETPNPCVWCNMELKHGILFDKAQELGCELMVTGHYARIIKDEDTGLYSLKKAVNISKDQSYFLYFMNQEQLSHTYFPLGDIENKDLVRELVKNEGLSISRKKESQDICFIPNGKYAEFIESYSKKTFPHGKFKDLDGNVLGEHKGIIRYTVGQRKGLGLSLKKPMYVNKKDISTNSVILSENSDLFKTELIAQDISFIDKSMYKMEKIECFAKIRYSHREAKGYAYPLPDNKLKFVFAEPARAISSGQALVLYDNDTVLGGGIIS